MRLGPFHLYRRSLALSVILTAGLSGCGPWPPLSVQINESSVQIDVRRLGEYGTSVSRIVLISIDDSSVLWEAVNTEAPQIPGFELQIGENPPMPKNLTDFGFSCVHPGTSGHFRLDRGVGYRVTVFSKSGKRSASADFELP